MVPSVLYVARLELDSTGSGSQPSEGEPCNTAAERHTKSKPVITLTVLLKIRSRILVTH